MANPKQPKAPTNAPTQPAPVTGTGNATPPSSASFTPSSAVKPWPRGDNGMKIVVTNQRHPAPRGPATPGA